MSSSIVTLPKGFIVNNKYSVLLFIKQGINAETYRLKGTDGKLYFLKLFDLAKMPRSSFDKDNNLLEIEFLKQVLHPNIATYKENGELIYEGRKFTYLILSFISGETLFEYITRERISTVYDIKRISKGILEGLKHLHNFENPIVHNEINPFNIMLDFSSDKANPIIIDFGYARFFQQSTKVFNREGINLNYIAPECFNNLYSPQSDLYSVGALIYHLLFGMPPWMKNISQYEISRLTAENSILEERRQPLKIPNIGSSVFDYDDSIVKIIYKALSYNIDDRFQTADEFIEALDGKIKIGVEENNDKYHSKGNVTSISPENKKGFKAIAGMSKLKEQLQNDVINLLESPEEYLLHDLGLPNGMLLYGPPGCGKTFFAEKFAEEAGYNFIKVVSSDIASIYVHGSQEKIGKLFKEAREKAPTILFFDELDAMVPNREKINNQSQSGEVNEFLSQLDNIGSSGVFVIGSTNKPDSIDKAVLRSGRLEKWFYIPLPDFEARKAMFELYLKDRPIDFGIDYAKLASLTENYVSSDIKLLIDEASRKTIKDKLRRITMQTLHCVIAIQKPTVSISELAKYEGIRKKIEEDIDDSNIIPRVGFR